MNRIQELLDDNEISQLGLAKALGITRSSVSQNCSNIIQPPLTQFMAICEYLGSDDSKLLVSKKNKK